MKLTTLLSAIALSISVANFTQSVQAYEIQIPSESQSCYDELFTQNLSPMLAPSCNGAMEPIKNEMKKKFKIHLAQKIQENLGNVSNIDDKTRQSIYEYYDFVDDLDMVAVFQIISGAIENLPQTVDQLSTSDVPEIIIADVAASKYMSENGIYAIDLNSDYHEHAAYLIHQFIYSEFVVPHISMQK